MGNLTATSRLRIVVLGYIVRGPLGGLAWHHLQYVIGLSQLGHDVVFVEDSDDFPSCYNPIENARGTDPTYGLAFAANCFDRVGLGDCWAFHDAHTGRWLGPQAERIHDICATADLCLNLSGLNPMRPWLRQIPARVLIDTDPVFTQIRHLSDAAARQRAQDHTVFLTFAENLPAGRATIPNDGLPWQATRQPIVLAAWPVTPAPRDGKFTSVLLWESYPAQKHDGQWYGLKADSFSPYVDLPQRVGRVFELALGSPSAPGPFLQSRGWDVIDPREPTRDPWTYQRYIQGSKAEFSIAKQGYVVSRSGWFSERSAAYLASGRPIVVQDTGFSDWLPAGTGVLPFTNPDEAVTAITSVSEHYAHHCRAARDIAAEFFDARTVLPQLIDMAMRAGTPSPESTGDRARVSALKMKSTA